MHFRDAEHLDGAAKITELHLSGNQLTVKSLEMLTEVVALSGADLREVDFSRNRIEVRDQEQKRAWLGFLRAFDGCCVLRKVNLSENVLGIGGIEMLARAYMQSDLDFAEGEDDDVLENDDDDEDVVDDMLALKINGYKEGGRSKKSPSKAKAKQNGKPLSQTNSMSTMVANMMWCRGCDFQLHWKGRQRDETLFLYSWTALRAFHHHFEYVYDDRGRCPSCQHGSHPQSPGEATCLSAGQQDARSPQ